MTDFKKIKDYYAEFNEKDRLYNDNSGKLEYEMTKRILQKYLPKKAKILDLGGGAGVYSFFLAELGYDVYLADLSENLIQQAIEQNSNKEKKIISCDVVNALDLSIYKNEQFDVVLLFGPLYHLLEKEERKQCLNEVNRVLKSNGIIFASFIPYLSGSIAIIDRYFRHPEQVDINNLDKVFKTVKFNNLSNKGFQEGYYPTVEEIESLFEECKFKTIEIKSIRGIGYEKENNIYNIKDDKIFNKMMDLIDQTSTKSEIIEMCGHAMYIGTKKFNEI